MPIPYRKEKLSSQIAKEISQILLYELRDPRKGFVTVTRAVVADDFRSAKVYVSVMGSEKDKKLTMSGLRSAVGFVQALLGKRLRVRHAPEVTFVRDDSVDRTLKLSKLIDDLAKERKAKESAPAMPEEE
ncbi:MAG TPA: 30S ribosome-binding factor RbfA [Planctomycetota bacterium]|jgi:ribosome-binding factor A|nr:30S ribosome-binding factor RbfA [Planctomycetota bacterium]